MMNDSVLEIYNNIKKQYGELFLYGKYLQSHKDYKYDNHDKIVEPLKILEEHNLIRWEISNPPARWASEKYIRLLPYGE